jgi:hypothetical protein
MVIGLSTSGSLWQDAKGLTHKVLIGLLLAKSLVVQGRGVLFVRVLTGRGLHGGEFDVAGGDSLLLLLFHLLLLGLTGLLGRTVGGGGGGRARGSAGSTALARTWVGGLGWLAQERMAGILRL